MGLAPNTTNQDLIRAVICLVMIIVCALLVSIDKLSVDTFLVVIVGVSGYYLGKSSSKGSLIE